jgi:fluoroacetyl-CoA thioesterase
VVGDTVEAVQDVTLDRTASHIGSGDLRVYATPAMALFVERTCREWVEATLAPGQTTVGVEICVRHLAPTPLGSSVRVRIELVEVDGPRLAFRAELWDATERVGEVDHRRRIVDVERFLRRVEAKSAGAS